MGCGALEITMDRSRPLIAPHPTHCPAAHCPLLTLLPRLFSTDCLRILRTLVDAIGDTCLVGVGTVEDKAQIGPCAAVRARVHGFAGVYLQYA